MAVEGGCHCGAVRYRAEGIPRHHALCFCADCRRSAGAPMVGWALFGQDEVSISGETASYNSSGDVQRRFCPACGTGLFYYSEAMFPGMVDIQSATLDDPDALAPDARIQMADAPKWVEEVPNMARFERYPGQ